MSKNSGVYLAQFYGFVKVGYSTNIKARITDLERVFKQECLKYFCFKTRFAQKVEAIIKRQYQPFCIDMGSLKSETFDIGMELLQESVEQLVKMDEEFLDLALDDEEVDDYYFAAIEEGITRGAYMDRLKTWIKMTDKEGNEWFVAPNKIMKAR